MRETRDSAQPRISILLFIDEHALLSGRTDNFFLPKFFFSLPHATQNTLKILNRFFGLLVRTCRNYGLGIAAQGATLFGYSLTI